MRNILEKLNIAVILKDKKTEKLVIDKRKYFNNIYIWNKENFVSSFCNCCMRIDAIILDLDTFYESSELIEFEKILALSEHQHFIFLAKNRRIYLKMLSNFNGGDSIILFKPIKLAAILDNLKILVPMPEINLVKITKSLSVDIQNETIYLNNEAIFLPKKLHKLALLLSSNLEQLIPFEEIDDIIFDGGAESNAVISNLVGTLKNRLTLNIKNIRSRGYVLYKDT